jgi:hypothetical protein
MSLLYKPKEEQIIEASIEILEDKRIIIDFYSDCGKFGAHEALTGYILTPERLLQILQDERNSYSENEI